MGFYAVDCDGQAHLLGTGATGDRGVVALNAQGTRTALTFTGHGGAGCAEVRVVDVDLPRG